MNYSDILSSLESINNDETNIDKLFNIHSEYGFECNLERIVHAAGNIAGILDKYIPSDLERNNILESVSLSIDFCNSENYGKLLKDLQDRTERVKDAIFVASFIPNVNIRGRLIEYLITLDDDTERSRLVREIVEECRNTIPATHTHNDLGDYCMVYDSLTTKTDIKTKVIYLNSMPKAYNVDDFLKFMGEGNNVFLFFFVGIDKNGIFNSILCSVYQDDLRDNTHIFKHWAGRNRRGTAQFNGDVINGILQNKESNTNHIDIDRSKEFLTQLIDI